MFLSEGDLGDGKVRASWNCFAGFRKARTDTMMDAVIHPGRQAVPSCGGRNHNRVKQ